MLYGYARVSTEDQTNDGQTDDLTAAGIQLENIVSEKVSGGVRAAARPGLSGLLDRLEEGDTLTVTKLDRLGRDAPDTLSLIRDLRERGLVFASSHWVPTRLALLES